MSYPSASRRPRGFLPWRFSNPGPQPGHNRRARAAIRKPSHHRTFASGAAKDRFGSRLFENAVAPRSRRTIFCVVLISAPSGTGDVLASEQAVAAQENGILPPPAMPAYSHPFRLGSSAGHPRSGCCYDFIGDLDMSEARMADSGTTMGRRVASPGQERESRIPVTFFLSSSI